MLKATASLESTMPLSLCRYVHEFTERDRNTDMTELEEKHWRKRCPQDADGNVVIEGHRFKLALADAAKLLGRKIAGRGNATYTKHFVAGVRALNNITLPLKHKDIEGEWLHLDAQGGNSGKKSSRVLRKMPTIPSWAGDVTFLIVDPVITRDVFMEYLHTAGELVGIGRWRLAAGGQKGGFAVTGIEFKETE